MQLRNTADPSKKRASTLVWGIGWIVLFFGVFEYYGVKGTMPWWSFSEWTWTNLDDFGWWWDVIAYGIPVWLLFHWRFRGQEFQLLLRLFRKLK